MNASCGPRRALRALPVCLMLVATGLAAAAAPARAQSPPVSVPGGPYAGNEGELIAFDGTGSFDPDGGALTYLWDFGDGGTATEAAPTHTFTTGGLFTVTLVVTDGEDLSDTGTTSAGVNGTPVAEANGPYTGNEGAAISFSSAGSSDPDGDALTYRWTFGDGATSTAANPTHTYVTGGPFTATLQVTDPGGLFNEDTAAVTVNGTPVAEANGPYTGNEGAAISFSSAGSSDPDGQPLTYRWDFGDGGTSTQANPNHTYTTGGTFAVTLRVTDPDDLFDEDTTTATVNRPPVAEANGPYTGNQGQSIAFSSAGSSDPDGDALTYLWTFGDGATSTAANPSHTYATGGVFSVVLRVTDPDNLFDEDTATATVNRPPVAEANGPYAGNEGASISFSSAGSSDPEGQALAYLWTFGDGTTSTAANPSHAYTPGGAFNVTLRVTDPGGLFSEDTATATVNRPPVADANGPYTGNEGASISFSSAGSGDPDGGAVTYRWNFGDGSTSTVANPSHTYATGGVYTVTLVVTDPGGLTATDLTSATVSGTPVAEANGPYTGNLGQAIAFSSAGSSDPDGQPLTYLWTFGDGTTSTAANPSHTYATGGVFNAILRVTDPGGLFDEDTATATVNRPPVAEANGPYAGNQGAPIAFSSAGSSDPEGQALTYLWTFGDGTTSTAANPSHAYTPGGTFDVTLRVTDPGGLFSEDTATATVNRPPVAEANGPYTGNEGATISFSSAGSGDPDGGAVTYRWNFGDGSTSTVANPSHTYATGGVYTVALVVTDPGGLTATDLTSATVSGTPVAEANGPYGANLGQAIAFSSAGSIDPDGQALTYLWTFGDGTTSTGENPSHTYATGGVFNVVLRVTDPGGLFDEDTATATVNRPPVAEANGPYAGNQGAPIAFSSAGSSDPEGQALAYLWTFGDGTTSTAANPSHAYTPGGTFNVTLRVTDPGGLFSEDTATATVNRPPVAEANGPYAGNQGAPIAFSSAGSSDPEGQALAYLWTFGDGTTSTAANPSHAYTPGGTFTVTLRVTDPGGLFSEDTATATVNRPPVADANGPYAGNEGQPIVFSSAGSSDPEGQALTYLWTFGDGATSTAANPSHTYVTGGTFNVTLRVTDPGGLFTEDATQAAVGRTPVANANGPYTGNEGQPIAFSSAGSGDPDGQQITYLWTFGDGATSTAANPSHTYVTGGTFTVTLRVTDPDNLFAEDTAQARVNRTPAAEANGPYSGNPGAPIAFSSAGSSDPDGDGLTYRWSFGDGATSTQANPSHAYAAGGTYTVTLRVTDPGGLFNEDTAQAVVNRPPVAEANGPYAGNQGAAISFSSTGSSDPDGQALTYLWTFGDGTTSTAANPTHSYTPGGSFIATLRVTDAGGLFAEDTAPVAVNRPPVADAGPALYTTDRGVPASFSSAGSSDPDGDPLTYLWEFGDGTTSTQANPTHIYTAGGAFTVNLRVRDPGGLTGTDLAAMSVNDLAVTAPATGAVWSEGSTQTITWSVVGTVDTVVVEYRTGAALPWIPLGTVIRDTELEWQVPDIGTSDETGVRVRVRRPNGLLSDPSDPFTIRNRVLLVTAPGGDAIYETEGTNIAWTSVGFIERVNLQYRLAPGSPWLPIAADEPDDGSFAWTLPEVTSDQERAQVRVLDAADTLATSDASAEFAILDRTLAVDSPDLGVVWSEGTTQTIAWTVDGPVDSVAIEFRRSPLDGYEQIARRRASAGSYSWSVAGVTADAPEAQVRVRETATRIDPVAGVSPVFTIQNRTLAITAPVAGEEISERAPYTIRWQSAGRIDNVRVEYRLQSAAPWQEIAASAPNTGAYLWADPPEVTSDESAAEIRVTDVATVPDLTQTVSPPFTLVDRVLAPTAPAPGAVACEADTLTIAWGSRGAIPNVTIEWRLDQGSPWQPVATNISNTGSAVWSTPDLPATADAVELRLRHATDPSVVAAWGPVTLRNRTLAFLRPLGGEVYSEGDAVPVSWSSDCIDSVRVEARVDAESPWQLQGPGVWSNTGQIIWSVIRVDTNQNAVQLRIADASDPDLVVAVSQPFTVLNRVLDVVRPTVTDSLSETATFPIAWDWVGTLQRVTIDYRLDPALDWVPIISNIVNTGTYTWTVPLVDRDHRSAQIRVFDTNNPNTIDEGDSFIIINRALALTRPAPGDTLTEATADTIRWSTRGVVPTVNVSYREQPVGAWQVIAAGISNTGVLAWSVPEVSGDVVGAQVRVESATALEVSAVSLPFVILDRSFAVLSPAGGESWSEATTQTIRWQSVGTIESVKIELLLPGGGTQLIVASTPNDGAETWFIPDVPAGIAGARIRLTDTRPPSASATSAPFDIVNRALAFTAPPPEPGVQWRIGSAQVIRWTSTGAIDSVAIELGRNGPGGAFETLMPATINDGDFAWEVTGPETWNAVLRVRDLRVADIRTETPLLALYDLVPPDLCADFDHSGGVSLDEIVRVEGIIVGALAASEADSLAADGTRDAAIDIRDILCGVDEMIAGERAGKGRPFVDAGVEEAAARGVVVGVGAVAESGSVPITVEARVLLAGLLVAIEIDGGSGEPALGAEGAGLALAWTATGPGRFTATVRREPGGAGLAAGTSTPLRVLVPASGGGGAVVRIVRAEAVAMDATLLPVHIAGGAAAVVPPRVALGQNRPNPFNPVTVIPFELPAAARVTLAVHDVSGRLVSRLVDGAVLPAGYHAVRWDGHDARGAVVPSGIYFATLRAGGETITRKMTVIR